MSKIIYIIKFFGKEDYAKEFLEDRVFYANPVGYFLNIEEGQGDKAEASIIDKPLDMVRNDIQVVDIKNGTYIPAFCCYIVRDTDIDGNRIVNIDRRNFNDFFKSGVGVAVVIPFNEFIEAVNTCKDVDKHDVVHYTKGITFNNTVDYSKDPLLAVFRKRDKYKYQNEYRIAFDDRIRGVVKPQGDGFCIDFKGLAKRYHYEHGLNIIGKYSFDDFVEDDNGYYTLDIGLNT